MAYVKRSKKTGKKRYTRKSSNLNSKIARIAKTVALRQQETKHSVLNWGTKELYHQGSTLVSQNLIDVTQGVNDTNHRIGDEITLRGLAVYVRFESKWDRPNTNFRLIIGRARHSIAGSPNILKAITGTNVQDPVDMEQVFKVHHNRVYRFGHQNTHTTGTPGSNSPTTFFRKIWIPLNNAKYKFLNQNSNQGVKFNIAMWAYAFDTSYDLTTDNIGSITVSGELFFKDA